MENGQLSSDPAHSGSINKSGEKTFHQHETLLEPPMSQNLTTAPGTILFRNTPSAQIKPRHWQNESISKVSGGHNLKWTPREKRKRWRGKKENRYFLGRIMGFYIDYYRHIGNVELTSGHTWKGQETEINPSRANLTQFHYRNANT